jgi:hypothetical protein
LTIDRGRPTYKLEELWKALDDGNCLFHRPALLAYLALGWSDSDAHDCLRHLSKRGFQKSMVGRDIKGWHDVYRTQWKGERIYLHFCRPTPDGPFLVASFKRDSDSDL